MENTLANIHRSIIVCVPDLLEVTDSQLISQGLIAASLSLNAEQTYQAYQFGLFPWFNPEDHFVLWWFPPERMILPCKDFHVSKNFKKLLKQIDRDNSDIRVSTDRAFLKVMQHCALPREKHAETWISDKIINTYHQLHERGIAHSIEVWDKDTLIGGLYGVCIGKMFYGESMFSKASNASKIGLYYLTRFLLKHDIQLIDCQQETSHLASLGAYPIPAIDFFEHLERTTSLDTPTWQANYLSQAGDYLDK